MTFPPIDRSLFPDSATIEAGRLQIGGVDVIELAERFGTPLFIYDEQQLVDRCKEAVEAFPGGVAYASKAFLCKAMARIAHQAGMAIDVATGGEMYVALEAGVPAEHLVLHGNNKSTAEIETAVEAGIGTIVVDSFDEMDRIEAFSAPRDAAVDVLIRLNPGIEAHTHEYLRTGVEDSKFGFPIVDGIAERAIERAVSSPAMRYRGVHAHVGSQVFEIDSFDRAIRALAPFVKSSGAEEFSIGGGLGVAYVEGEQASSISEWGAVARRVAADAGITARITAEPGRSIVAAAGITAYTVGTIKQIPEVRTYVSVDGGMSDNPRPVLYGSGYEATLARSVDRERSSLVRIVGKHCESGDVIVRDAAIQDDLAIDDIVVTPVTGAYGHSMGSNYNKVLRPAVVFVRDGSARLVIERETYSDLTVRDVG
ncbi:MAG: diaminopimelate decarboxylase [Acidimicrobiia bacterium]|nr:diaminopimelate decarboxylase [Acidimicrobiia bacterium]